MPIVVEYEGLSFPSLGIGKPATISITGWNSSGSTSLFKDAFKVPNLPTFTPTYFPSATKRSSSGGSSHFGLKDFLGNLWKKGIAPALTLGLSYATQRAILKAAGVKHPEIIIAKEFGLPLSSFPETTPKSVVYTPQPPPPPHSTPTHTTIIIRQPPPPPPPPQPTRPTTDTTHTTEWATTTKERLPNHTISHRRTQAESDGKHDVLGELFKNKQLMYLAGLLLLVLLLRR